MTFGSLFAGAGGFDMGLEAAGLRCLWQVEIDRTARSVLARHWPDVPKLPDVRKVGVAELAPVDVLVGGFPCQDLSLAGKRAGLAGDRSGLWWEMLRVIRELQPGTVVWENVPGLRSNDEGRDLPRVLCSLAEHGYFGCVRTLDAQHFGVPQSRPRLFGVFARGPDGARRACEILAVRDSLPWHSQAGQQAGAEVASSLTGSSGRRCGAPGKWGEVTHNLVFGGNDTRGAREVATAINAKGGTGRSDFETENFVLQCHGSNVGPFGTLRRGNGGVTGGVPFVFESKKAGEGRGDGLAPTLRAMGHDGSHANAGGQLAAFIVNSATSCATESHARQVDKARSLDTSGGFASGQGGTLLQDHGAMRRLTPRECERLMDWPDDWTRWRDNGKEIADGPRYRLTGNGVVRRVAWWIGRRLMEATK